MYTVKLQVIDEKGVEIFNLSVPATQAELMEDDGGGPGMSGVAAVLVAASAAAV